MFDLYDKVKIKETDEIGFIVLIDDNGGKDSPIYFVEKDEEYEGEDALVWKEKEEIELVE